MIAGQMGRVGGWCRTQSWHCTLDNVMLLPAFIRQHQLVNCTGLQWLSKMNLILGKGPGVAWEVGRQKSPQHVTKFTALPSPPIVKGCAIQVSLFSGTSVLRIITLRKKNILGRTASQQIQWTSAWISEQDSLLFMFMN